MGIMIWLVVGVIIGYLVRITIPGTQEETDGFLGNMLLGIVGGIIGGWVWDLFLAAPGASVTEIGSSLAAAIGAVLVIATMRLLSREPTRA